MEELFANAQMIDVRILNKIDTYQNWMNSDKVLGAGEIAIATIDSGDATGLTPPAVGIRVGNGTDRFSKLNWIQATAGDVHEWAKAANKPSYKATEIEDLDLFIAGEIEDTNTQYTFAFADNKLTIKAYDVAKNEKPEDAQQVAELTLADSTKLAKLSGATEGHVVVAAANGEVADGGVALSALAKDADVKATYATKAELAAEVEAIEAAAGELGEAIEANATAIGELQAADVTLQANIDNKVAKVTGAVGDVVVFAANGEVADSGIKAADLAKSADVADVYETKAHAAEEISRVEGVVGGINSRLETAEGEIDDLQAAVEVLNGTGEGSVQATVDAAINKFATDIGDDDTVDSFKELVDWVATHGGEAAEMAKAIKENADAIDVLEGVSHDHDNMDVLEGIAQADVDAARSAVQSISGVEATKTGTNVEVTAVSTDLLKQGAKVLVFNCGSASEVF